jgi:hypothetical protein
MRTHRSFVAARTLAPFVLVVAACGGGHEAARAPRPASSSSVVASASSSADAALQRDLDRCRVDSSEASCAPICKRAETATRESERATAKDACDAARSVRDEDAHLRAIERSCAKAAEEESCTELREWLATSPKRHVEEAKASLAQGEVWRERKEWRRADARWCRAAPADIACEGIDAYLAKYPSGLHAAAAKHVLAAAAPKLATIEDRISRMAKASGVTIRRVRLRASLEALVPGAPIAGDIEVGDLSFDAHRESNARAKSVKVSVSCGVQTVDEKVHRLTRSIDVPLEEGLVRARLLGRDDKLRGFSMCELAIDVAALKGPSQTTTFCWDDRKLREGSCKTKLVLPEPPPHAVVVTATGDLADLLKQNVGDGEACYVEELDADPTLAGVVEYDVRLRDGDVTSRRVVSSTGGPLLEACVADELMRDFRPIASGEGRLRYSFELR